MLLDFTMTGYCAPERNSTLEYREIDISLMAYGVKGKISYCNNGLRCDSQNGNGLGTTQAKAGLYC
jgi:hypothetical protein